MAVLAPGGVRGGGAARVHVLGDLRTHVHAVHAVKRRPSARHLRQEPTQDPQRHLRARGVHGPVAQQARGAHRCK